MGQSRKKIKKSRVQKGSSSGIRTASPDDARLTFSFRLFDSTDKEVCPETFEHGYTQALMQRLKDLSTWYVSELTGSRSSSIRSHPIEWSDTKRPEGFSHLNEQFDSYQALQFSISSNEHGRVHGLLIGSCFHVIWLDCNHVVYS